MVKECSQKRRRDMGCVPASSCRKHARCCLQNTLRWRPDFAAQKCRLEQTCDAVGVKFLMLMICHPECNPIEGGLGYRHKDMDSDLRLSDDWGLVA